MRPVLAIGVGWLALAAGCQEPNPAYRGTVSGLLDGGSPEALDAAVSEVSIDGLADAARADAVRSVVADGGPVDAAGRVVGADTALIGWWKFDETAGALAGDSSGFGQTGRLVGTPPDTVHVPGHSGRAIELDGKGSIQVPRSATLDSITSGVTVAAWVRIDGPIEGEYTVANRQVTGSGDEYYGLFVGHGGGPYACASAAACYFSNPSLHMGTWVHLCMTSDNTTMRTFVNGIAIGAISVSASLGVDTTPLNIGAQSDNLTGAGTVDLLFVGALDDVVLYRRALSPAEVARLAAGADPTTF